MLRDEGSAIEGSKQSHPAPQATPPSLEGCGQRQVEGGQYQHGSENPTTELPVTALSIPMWAMWANASSARAGQLPTPQQISQSLPHDQWLK